MKKCEFRKVFEKIADNIYQRERYKHPTWHRSSQHMVRGDYRKVREVDDEYHGDIYLVFNPEDYLSIQPYLNAVGHFFDQNNYMVHHVYSVPQALINGKIRPKEETFYNNIKKPNLEGKEVRLLSEDEFKCKFESDYLMLIFLMPSKMIVNEQEIYIGKT